MCYSRGWDRKAYQLCFLSYVMLTLDFASLQDKRVASRAENNLLGNDELQKLPLNLRFPRSGS